jgi:hypothetical protein
MQRLILALTALVLLAGVASADTLTYRNDRFGTTISFPAELFDQRAEPPVNGDGMRWLAPDGAELAVFGQLNALDFTPQTLAEFVAEGLPGDANVTYQRIGRNWLVMSGYYGDRIYYQRHEFGATGIIHAFVLEYPTASRRIYDDEIAGIANSLSGP